MLQREGAKSDGARRTEGLGDGFERGAIGPGEGDS